MSNMKGKSSDSQTEILLSLHQIEDRLKEITDILKMGHRENIKASRDKVITASPLRKKIFVACDGKKSVGQIARSLGKSIQQISNNIAVLQSAGLIREVRKGKVKCYVKVR